MWGGANQSIIERVEHLESTVSTLADSIKQKLDTSRVTQLKSVTQPGYAVDARELNASLSGTVANEMERMNESLSGCSRLFGGQMINSESDLNDYSSPGNYYCGSSSIAGTLKNSPTIDAFTMKVEFATGVGYPCQTLRDFIIGTLYYRVFDPFKNQWTAWKKINLVPI